MQIGIYHALIIQPLMACVTAAALLIPFNSSAEDVSEQIGPDAKPYVILLRHADAPGRGEPENFDLNNCDTQRNLSDRGRAEAIELGNKLRALNVKVTKVVASRWCRTKETARLLNFGAVEDSRVFDNLELNKINSQALLDKERHLIASWRGPGVLIIVTHSSNLNALAHFAPEPGSIIVAQPRAGLDSMLLAQINLLEPLSLALQKRADRVQPLEAPITERLN
jgi:phosphohistidine phosphatase SixA